MTTPNPTKLPSVASLARAIGEHDTYLETEYALDLYLVRIGHDVDTDTLVDLATEIYCG